MIRPLVVAGRMLHQEVVVSGRPTTGSTVPGEPGRGRSGAHGRRRLLAAVAVVVVVTVAALALTGVIDLGVLADPERLRGLVQSAGAAGPVLFVLLALAMHLAQVGGLTTVVAVLIWPTPAAMLMTYSAALLSSVMVFALVRCFGRDWADRRIPLRLRSLTARLEARPATTVALVRLPAFINFGVDCVLALSRIRFRVLVVFTALALVPSTIWNVLFSNAVVSVLGRVPAWGWAAIAGAVAMGLLVWWARARRRSPSTDPVDGDLSCT